LREPKGERDLCAAVAGLCAAAVMASPLPYGHNPYGESAAIAPLDAHLWHRAALAASFACLFVAGARSGASLTRMLSLALPLSIGVCAYTWWFEAGGANDPGVALLAAPALASLWLLDGARRGKLARACVASLVLLGLGYLIAPLRFAGPHNRRVELKWFQAKEERGDLLAPVEVPTDFYSWIVLYHSRGDDYSITYERQRQITRIAPKD
jgi:hypothetical protein